MKITKEILINKCQDFINSYYGSYGDISYLHSGQPIPFKYGIDEGFYYTINDELHFIIQGTDEDREWLGNEKSNLNFIKKINIKPLNNHLGKNKYIKVHPGFYNSFLTMKDFLRDISKRYKYIFIGGHSRGAGIATVAARDVKYQIDNVWKTNQEVILITGGSPRVYNFDGAEEFDDSGIISYRLKYCNDLVCNVPWIINGYKHVGRLLDIGGFYLPLPIGLPTDHRPDKYLKAMKKYNGRI